MECEHTQRLAPELALGIADGAERAAALRHVAGCTECRRAVQELSELTDGLLLLAPEHEPPLGFESRVLARLRPPAAPRVRRRRRLFTLLAPTAAAAAIAAGVVLGATRDDVRLADQYRDTLAAAHGTSFEAARLHTSGEPAAGVVYAYRGAPSWIFVYVDAAHRARPYRVELSMTSGEKMSLPALRLDPATGSAGSAIPYDVHDVAAVRLIGPGGDALEARLPHAVS